MIWFHWDYLSAIPLYLCSTQIQDSLIYTLGLLDDLTVSHCHCLPSILKSFFLLIQNSNMKKHSIKFLSLLNCLALSIPMLASLFFPHPTVILILKPLNCVYSFVFTFSPVTLAWLINIPSRLVAQTMLLKRQSWKNWRLHLLQVS